MKGLIVLLEWMDCDRVVVIEGGAVEGGGGGGGLIGLLKNFSIFT